MEFEVFKPKYTEDACHILTHHKGNIRVVAGATDLSIRAQQPDFLKTHLLDINSLGLDYINDAADRIIIGACAKIAAISENPFIKEEFPALSTAAKQMGGPQIRNVATIGGNIMNASPAGDSLPPLIVYSASLKIQSKEGELMNDIESFFLSPGKTIGKPDELLIQVEIPRPTVEEGINSFSNFYKYGKRRANIISNASFAYYLRISGAEIIEVKIAGGSIAPIPKRLYETELFFIGKNLDSPLSLAELEQSVKVDISPISDIRGSKEFKERLIINSCIRMFTEIGGKSE